MTYHVHAEWDAEASVWVATSEDVPGLATEAATIEQLTEKLHVMVPELLEANGIQISPKKVDFELTSRRHELVQRAS